MRIALTLVLLVVSRAKASGLIVEDVGPASEPTRIEIRGTAAGPFDPEIWRAGTLHLVRDVRRPLLSPRAGKFRNVYAPSAVGRPDGSWHVYYGGWDGGDSGNDRIYVVNASGSFSIDGATRRTVIEHGLFQHVCNVNVTAWERGLAMMCTAYPDSRGRNKPVTFIGDELAHTPLTADRAHFVKVAGYPAFDDADINGMNVLLRDGGRWRMYFGNFRDAGKTFVAAGEDGRAFVYEGVALAPSGLVNDVKKFRVGPDDWYLMGLHGSGGTAWYSLSRDGRSFEPQRELLRSGGAGEAYVVAVGLVVAGEQDEPGRRLLGVLYGAGAAKTLDANRIFARWLQKRVVLVSAGKRIDAAGGLGPDAQVFGSESAGRVRIELLAEDGKTPIGSADGVELTSGRAYSLRVRPPR